jgi:hypothetical protein
VSVAPTATAGSYPLTLTATIAGHTRTATAQLTVTPPDFRGVQFPSGVARVSTKGIAQIALTCPSEAVGQCGGKLTFTHNRGSHSFSLPPGRISHVPVNHTRNVPEWGL